ncbi:MULTISPECIES: hypothetical protein [unclassified Microbacterium]|uniref:hypothetical protein n=1 Tax=unclassified Microbacterium TaxID=2609290 RepID=UPI00300F7F98
MNREHLIEKAAKAIDPPAWTGGIAHDPRWADEAEARRISAMRQARAAFSVFEEAHAVGSFVPVVSDVQETAHVPTLVYGSEWEQPETAVERILDEAGYGVLEPWRADVVRAIAEWVAPLRRTVNAPTDDEREALGDCSCKCGHLYHSECYPRTAEWGGCFDPEPTDDEREALRDAFDEMHRITEGGCDTEGKDVADMVIALGFRRTVQGEPSDATLGVMAQRFYEASGLNIPHTSKPEVVRGLRAALRAAAEAEGGNR